MFVSFCRPSKPPTGGNKKKSKKLSKHSAGGNIKKVLAFKTSYREKREKGQNLQNLLRVKHKNEQNEIEKNGLTAKFNLTEI